jgi:hypothetical protein
MEIKRTFPRMRLSHVYHILTFYCILAVALLEPRAAPQKTGTPSISSTPIAELSFDLFHNRIYLPVEVNGHKGFSMIVDTGAAMTGLSEVSAQTLQLEHKGHARVGGNGSATLPISFAEDVTLQIGEATLEEKKVAVVPYYDLEISEGRPVAGILGIELFRRYVVVVDYGTRTLALYEPKSFIYKGNGEVVSLEFGKGPMPIFHASIYVNGHDPIIATLSVDSGTYSGLRLYSPFVKKQHLLQPAPPILDSFGFGLGGEFPEKLGRVQALTIGTLNIQQPVTSFPEAQHGVTASDINDGTIGGAVLRQFKVTFDYSRNQMMLDPIGNVSAPFPTDTSGLVIGSQGPELKIVSIRHVLADTPAAAAGVRDGDTIISINGTESQALGVEGIRNLLCNAGTYRLQLRRGQQELDITMNTSKQLY